jgi:hypothetical protein
MSPIDVQCDPGKSRAAGDSQEDHERPVQSQDVRVVEYPDFRAQPCPAHGGDLVHHDPARRLKAVAVVRFDQQPEQRRIGGIRGERAQNHRVSIEVIVLHDHRGSWFSPAPGYVQPTAHGWSDAETAARYRHRLRCANNPVLLAGDGCWDVAATQIRRTSRLACQRPLSLSVT